MFGDGITPWARTWSASLFGCAAVLAVDLLPDGKLTWPLVAQLAWLALLGSAPTTLILASAERTSRQSRTVVWATSATLLLLGLAVAWSHTDFLLAGPRWAMHSGRGATRVLLTVSFGALAVLAWWWLLLVARTESKRTFFLASITTTAVVVVCIVVARRYRAYDFTMAQLVFPCGVLASALFDRLNRRSDRMRNASFVLSAGFLLLAVGSRASSAWSSSGEREVLTNSRTGSLVSLYVLPHTGTEQHWSEGELECDLPQGVLEDARLPMTKEQRRNVIIISVDALRRDVVGSIVRGKQVTPELSRYAAAGLSFARATTTYPATLFAMGSAFTGLSPAELYLSPALPDTIFTASRTRVDTQLVVLPDVSWFRFPIVRELLTRGVDVNYAASDEVATETLISKLDAARRNGASVMAWIHYYAPHHPYRTHPSRTFGKGRKNAYLSEAAHFDSQLGRLMRYLESSRWFKDTLVVFFSDHGEALGEDGYFGHHVYLDGWMTDVPLVLWHAALDPAEATVSVSVADVAPTVLHFLGLPQPSDLPSQSLFSLGPTEEGRSTFSEAFPIRGRELFDSFRLRSSDETSVRARLRSIRVSSPGYEPKGAVSRDGARLIHHRSADRVFVKPPASDEGALAAELDRWEREQLRRIQCRLRITASRE